MIFVNARFLTQRITGVQRFAIEIAFRLKKEGLNVVFISPKNILNKEIASQLDVEFVGTNTGHVWEQFDLPIFLKKKGSPLLLNLCNTAPLIYINSVVTIHDLAFLENPSWFSRRFYFAYKFLVPRIVKKSKKIFTVSEFSKSEIVNKLKVNKSKVSVIYNGVDDRFNNPVKRKADSYVLFVGSLDPRKNMERLIEAFRYIPSETKLKIIGGNNNLFKSLYDSNDLTDRVEFLGYVSDKELFSLYASARCFVYPSLYEGFGIPPLEAQSVGVPVVVSDLPVFREVLANSALYCNPLKSKSIADAISKILDLGIEERNRIVDSGFVNVRRFSWKKSAINIIQHLKELE